MKVLRRLPMVGAGLLLALSLARVEQRPAHAGCEPPAEQIYVGLALATMGANGQWVGRWLGAHPLACDGDTYVLPMAGPSWGDLERSLATAPVERYLAGDVPYAGDGTCIPGALRRWWNLGDRASDGSAMTWQAASAPPDAPTFPCPINAAGDGPLRLLAPPVQ